MQLTNRQLKRIIEVVKGAERVLGPLEPGQVSDLLLDNCPFIPGVTESHEIVRDYLRRV